MFKFKKGFMISLLLLLILLLAVGCSESDEDSNSQGNNDTEADENAEDGDAEEADAKAPQAGGEVVIGVAGDFINLDPILSTSGDDYPFVWGIYDTLVTYDSDLEIQPGLAESWEFPDDTSIVLQLKKDVKFHDGTDFDAEAVKFNIERANSEDSVIPDLRHVEEVEVIDTHTVKLHLSVPDASILLALTERPGLIASPAAIEKDGEEFQQNPVGTGPFKFVSHVPNGELIYEKNDDYWKEEEPYIDKLIFKVMQQETTRINALKSGEVDIIAGISPFSIDSLETAENIKLEMPNSSHRSKGIVFNASMEPFDNLKFRQAVTHAIDRDIIVDTLSNGYGEPLYQIFPNDFWAADPDLKIEYDPEKAKQLLEESGVEDPSFTMLVSQQDFYEPMFTDIITEQLAAIGITVETETLEGTAAYQKMWAEKESQAMSSGTAGKPDPHLLMEIWVIAESFFNAGEQTTPEFDELIVAANSTNDQEERAELYHEINRMQALDEVVNIIPVMSVPIIYALNENVHGFAANGLGKSNFNSVWIEE